MADQIDLPFAIGGPEIYCQDIESGVDFTGVMLQSVLVK